jgi:hypothetical protein
MASDIRRIAIGTSGIRVVFLDSVSGDYSTDLSEFGRSDRLGASGQRRPCFTCADGLGIFRCHLVLNRSTCNGRLLGSKAAARIEQNSCKCLLVVLLVQMPRSDLGDHKRYEAGPAAANDVNRNSPSMSVYRGICRWARTHPSADRLSLER